MDYFCGAVTEFKATLHLQSKLSIYGGTKAQMNYRGRL